jgi:ArsR family transcriptional regulator
MRIRRCMSQEEQAAALSCPVTARQEELAKLAWALAHPARLRILSILRERSTCLCGDLVERMPLSQSTVSEHLKVLKEAGLVQAEADGARTCYSVSEQGLGRLKGLVAEL